MEPKPRLVLPQVARVIKLVTADEHDDQVCYQCYLIDV